jgi:hypothetical protein
MCYVSGFKGRFYEACPFCHSYVADGNSVASNALYTEPTFLKKFSKLVIGHRLIKPAIGGAVFIFFPS